MDASEKTFDRSCYEDCESAYSRCTRSKDDESVCKMKMAQCSCGCILQ
jgi:hypothetical protein